MFKELTTTPLTYIERKNTQLYTYNKNTNTYELIDVIMFQLVDGTWGYIKSNTK